MDLNKVIVVWYMSMTRSQHTHAHEQPAAGRMETEGGAGQTNGGRSRPQKPLGVTHHLVEGAATVPCKFTPRQQYCPLIAKRGGNRTQAEELVYRLRI